jgi:hypothetical protein
MCQDPNMSSGWYTLPGGGKKKTSMFHGEIPRVGDHVTLSSPDGNERRYVVARVEWHSLENTPPEPLPLNLPEIVLHEIPRAYGGPGAEESR